MRISPGVGCRSRLMLERGVLVFEGTVRHRCAKFGQGCANGPRRRRPRPGDTRHLGEVFIKIGGERKHPWGPWTPTAPFRTSSYGTGGTPLRPGGSPPYAARTLSGVAEHGLRIGPHLPLPCSSCPSMRARSALKLLLIVKSSEPESQGTFASCR